MKFNFLFNDLYSIDFDYNYFNVLYENNINKDHDFLYYSDINQYLFLFDLNYNIILNSFLLLYYFSKLNSSTYYDIYRYDMSWCSRYIYWNIYNIFFYTSSLENFTYEIYISSKFNYFKLYYDWKLPPYENVHIPYIDPLYYIKDYEKHPLSRAVKAFWIILVFQELNHNPWNTSLDIDWNLKDYILNYNYAFDEIYKGKYVHFSSFLFFSFFSFFNAVLNHNFIFSLILTDFNKHIYIFYFLSFCYLCVLIIFLYYFFNLYKLIIFIILKIINNIKKLLKPLNNLNRDFLENKFNDFLLSLGDIFWHILKYKHFLFYLLRTSTFSKIEMESHTLKKKPFFKEWRTFFLGQYILKSYRRQLIYLLYAVLFRLFYFLIFFIIKISSFILFKLLNIHFINNKLYILFIYLYFSFYISFFKYINRKFVNKLFIINDYLNYELLTYIFSVINTWGSLFLTAFNFIFINNLNYFNYNRLNNLDLPTNRFLYLFYKLLMPLVNNYNYKIIKFKINYFFVFFYYSFIILILLYNKYIINLYSFIKEYKFIYILLYNKIYLLYIYYYKHYIFILIFICLLWNISFYILLLYIFYYILFIIYSYNIKAYSNFVFYILGYTYFIIIELLILITKKLIQLIFFFIKKLSIFIFLFVLYKLNFFDLFYNTIFIFFFDVLQDQIIITLIDLITLWKKINLFNNPILIDMERNYTIANIINNERLKLKNTIYMYINDMINYLLAREFEFDYSIFDPRVMYEKWEKVLYWVRIKKRLIKLWKNIKNQIKSFLSFYIKYICLKKIRIWNLYIFYYSNTDLSIYLSLRIYKYIYICFLFIYCYFKFLYFLVLPYFFYNFLINKFFFFYSIIFIYKNLYLLRGIDKSIYNFFCDIYNHIKNYIYFIYFLRHIFLIYIYIYYISNIFMFIYILIKDLCYFDINKLLIDTYINIFINNLFILYIKFNIYLENIKNILFNIFRFSKYKWKKGRDGIKYIRTIRISAEEYWDSDLPVDVLEKEMDAKGHVYDLGVLHYIRLFPTMKPKKFWKIYFLNNLYKLLKKLYFYHYIYIYICNYRIKSLFLNNFSRYYYLYYYLLLVIYIKLINKEKNYINNIDYNWKKVRSSLDNDILNDYLMNKSYNYYQTEIKGKKKIVNLINLIEDSWKLVKKFTLKQINKKRRRITIKKLFLRKNNYSNFYIGIKNFIMYKNLNKKNYFFDKNNFLNNIDKYPLKYFILNNKYFNFYNIKHQDERLFFFFLSIIFRKNNFVRKIYNIETDIYKLISLSNKKNKKINKIMNNIINYFHDIDLYIFKTKGPYILLNKNEYTVFVDKEERNKKTENSLIIYDEYPNEIYFYWVFCVIFIIALLFRKNIHSIRILYSQKLSIFLRHLFINNNIFYVWKFYLNWMNEYFGFRVNFLFSDKYNQKYIVPYYKKKVRIFYNKLIQLYDPLYKYKLIYLINSKLYNNYPVFIQSNSIYKLFYIQYIFLMLIIWLKLIYKKIYIKIKDIIKRDYKNLLNVYINYNFTNININLYKEKKKFFKIKKF